MCEDLNKGLCSKSSMFPDLAFQHVTELEHNLISHLFTY